MKRSIIILFLFFSLLSCKGQDFVEWVQSDGSVPCTEGYGLLYNWPVTQGTGNASITSSDDWVVPSDAQYVTLREYLGGASVAGGKMKETGLTYWQSPNTGATNESGFNARGSGNRVFNGNYTILKGEFKGWTRTAYDATYSWEVALANNLTNLSIQVNAKGYGNSIRLVYVGAGTPTSYTGNDGKKYRVVLIGTQYWLADNLQETKFRNGDIIPFHGVDNVNNFTNAEWAALTTAGVCGYNNDVANVGCNFTFPTE